MIKAILFDLDETLLNQKDASAAALKKFHALHCAHLPWEKVRERWDYCLANHFQRYVRGEITFQQQRRCRIRDLFENPGLDDESADRLFSTYLSEYEQGYVLFPDVLPFFASTSGFRFGVITNGETRQQKDKLVRTGIRSHFDAVLVSEEVGLRKPDPEIFNMAARMLDVLPGECLFIGDNFEADYLGSKGAGMHAVLINRDEPKSDPDIRSIRSFAEIQPILTSLGKGAT